MKSINKNKIHFLYLKYDKLSSFIEAVLIYDKKTGNYKIRSKFPGKPKYNPVAFSIWRKVVNKTSYYKSHRCYPISADAYLFNFDSNKIYSRNDYKENLNCLKNDINKIVDFIVKNAY
ncbi:MAG: hypothetical protein NZZ41_03125 [Candidatus Dojkabacteria bacterium]|nr:hypothetical protein [Candidatus Dojkabacteria bacterium]